MLVQKNLSEGDCIAHVLFPFRGFSQNFCRGNSAMWQGWTDLFQKVNLWGSQREVFFSPLLTCFSCGLCLASEACRGLRGLLERDVPPESLKTRSENKLQPCTDKLRQILPCHLITKLLPHFYSFLDVYAFDVYGLAQSWMEKICSKTAATRFSSSGSSSFCWAKDTKGQLCH